MGEGSPMSQGSKESQSGWHDNNRSSHPPAAAQPAGSSSCLCGGGGRSPGVQPSGMSDSTRQTPGVDRRPQTAETKCMLFVYHYYNYVPNIYALITRGFMMNTCICEQY